eukprot:40902-Pleurochrysis_carterae.AAC.1
MMHTPFCEYPSDSAKNRYKVPCQVGAQQLLPSNLPFIEHLLSKHSCPVSLSEDSPFGAAVKEYFEVYFVADFAGARAIEGCVCGCNAAAMHDVPSSAALSSVDRMLATTSRCDCVATAKERTIRSHTSWKQRKRIPL